MRQKKCKNKKCQRLLPEQYKHKLCENCRNKRINTIKDVGKGAATLAAIAVAFVTRGKINLKRD